MDFAVDLKFSVESANGFFPHMVEIQPFDDADTDEQIPFVQTLLGYLIL